jgi:hypothetical protein
VAVSSVTAGLSRLSSDASVRPSESLRNFTDFLTFAAMLRVYL